MQYALRLLLLGALGARADLLTILQPPAGKSGPPGAWILVPGAEIDKEAYTPMALAVQKASSMPLWVAILGTYVGPTVLPPEMGPRIDNAMSTMESQGLDLKTVKLFYGGHSLGSVFIQDHLAGSGSSGPLGGKVAVLGQVLMGGFLQRKYVYPEWIYPVTTLTIGGELDGLARPTRLAEAFYHSKGKEDFPVVMVPGMSHLQFASGEPPLLVKLRDLQPEVSLEAAHATIASLVAPYFEQLATGVEAKTSYESTADFLEPLIKSYELEGSRYFNAPEQIGGPGADKCVKGGCPSKSGWVGTAQTVISQVEGWTLKVDNQYVDSTSTPLTGAVFHLPVIKNDTATKTLSITTYSQGFWDDVIPSWFSWKEIFDKFDTGFIATSAEELGSKLSSRQCTLIQGLGQTDTNFSVDDPDFCAMANEKAYQWALDNAGPATKERFDKYGMKYTFGKDIPKAGGPLFLDARLQFNEVADATGEKVIEVVAPMQKTEIDYWTRHFGPLPKPSFLPDPGCFHYCKLLSPARAMEWIYIDSLRAKRSIQPAASVVQV